MFYYSLLSINDVDRTKCYRIGKDKSLWNLITGHTQILVKL